jgi:hypothetical protein
MGVPTHGEAGQVGCHFFVTVAALGATACRFDELPILERSMQFWAATGIVFGGLTDGAGRGVLHHGGILIKRRGRGP